MYCVVTQRTVYLHHALYEKWENCENWLGRVGIMKSHLYPEKNNLGAAT